MSLTSKVKSGLKSFKNSILGQSEDNSEEYANAGNQAASTLNNIADSTKTTQQLYDEASPVAAKAANDIGNQAAAQTLAAGKISGGGKLGNAIRASQAGTNASLQAYQNNLNNAASLAQEQSNTANQIRSNAATNQLNANLTGAQSTTNSRQTNAANKQRAYATALSGLSSLFN